MDHKIDAKKRFIDYGGADAVIDYPLGPSRKLRLTIFFSVYFPDQPKVNLRIFERHYGYENFVPSKGKGFHFDYDKIDGLIDQLRELQKVFELQKVG